MGILSDNPKNEPLHYGEIFHLWTFSNLAKGCISFYQAHHSHAGDKDLKQLLENLIAQAKQEAMECDKLLSDAGIMPPPTMPDRPKVKLEDIPAGIRLSDLEIAAALAVDIGVSLPTCSTIIGVSIREDVAALFVKYHAKKIIFATETMRLSKEKGWLIPPPLQLKRPENDNSK